MQSSHRFLIAFSCLFLLLGLAPAFAQTLSTSGGASLDGLSGPCLGGGGFPGSPCCGDGICEAGELCLADCASCGDGVCSGNEDCSTCSADCGGCPACGDGICNGFETCANCSDCSSCFPSELQAFYRGNETENIYTAFSQAGTIWSGNQVLGNNSETEDSPGAAILNDRMFVFHRGMTGDRVYYSWSDDGHTWAANQQLGNGAETISGVAAAAFNNRLYVFHRGKSRKALWVSSSSSGMVWSALDHKRITSDGNGLFGTPAPVVFDGRLHVFYLNTADKIKSTSTADGLTWTQGPVIPGATGDGVGVAVFNNRLHMVITKPIPGTIPGTIADEHRLHYRIMQLDGTWSADVPILTAKTDRRPALVATDDRLVVLYKRPDSDNRLFYAYSFDGVNWAGDVPAAGETSEGGPALIYTD